MTEPRILAEVKDYDGLVAALRSRIGELNVAGATIDATAGLPDRYVQKLLGAVPTRHLGRISLGPLLGVLAVKLLVAEDPEAHERISHRLTPRRDHRNYAGDALLAVKSRKRRPHNVLRNNPARARFLRAVQVLGQSPAKRSQIARQAATERWRRAPRPRPRSIIPVLLPA